MQVVAEQPDGDFLEGSSRRRYVGAPRIVIDPPLQTPDLALDLAQAAQVLPGGIPSGPHGSSRAGRGSAAGGVLAVAGLGEAIIARSRRWLSRAGHRSR